MAPPLRGAVLLLLLLQCELVIGFQHAETRLDVYPCGLLDQALVDQGCQAVQDTWYRPL